MMSTDALDYAVKGRPSKKIKKEFAIKKQSEETRKFLSDNKEIKKCSQLFQQTVERQLKEAGIR